MLAFVLSLLFGLAAFAALAAIRGALADGARQGRFLLMALADMEPRPAGGVNPRPLRHRALRSPPPRLAGA